MMKLAPSIRPKRLYRFRPQPILDPCCARQPRVEPQRALHATYCVSVLTKIRGRRFLVLRQYRTIACLVLCDLEAEKIVNRRDSNRVIRFYAHPPP